jgi:pectinesterase
MRRTFIAFELLFCFLTLKALPQDKVVMTVSQDGKGDFTSIQVAIDATKAFPDARITINIKNGIYYEKVVIPSCNTHLSLIGESSDKTVITFNDFFGKINRGRNSTFYTYTMLVEADDFYAENLTIENSAGPVGQAVALHVEGDRCSFRNCRILGHQDTLYAAGQQSRQYFSGCYIEGTTDFIFGAATVLFDKCTIHSRGNSFITAASTPKGKPYGFVFNQCKLTAAEGINSVYLGRPWRDYAKTVFLYCEMGSHIRPQGWSNWDKTTRDKTACYGEYQNYGPGASTGNRVSWSYQLTPKQASQYTINNILSPAPPVEPDPKIWTSGKE